MAVTLQKRVELAIQAGYSVGALAAAAGKKSSAVSQWKSGGVKTIKADSVVGLARLTGWSQEWWATGKGPQEVKPGELIQLDEQTQNLVRAFTELDEAQKAEVYARVWELAAIKIGSNMMADKFGTKAPVPDHIVAKSLPPAPSLKNKAKP
jgi:hypothetical protein